jgi:hypothetical protein
MSMKGGARFALSLDVQRGALMGRGARSCRTAKTAERTRTCGVMATRMQYENAAIGRVLDVLQQRRQRQTTCPLIKVAKLFHLSREENDEYLFELTQHHSL